MERNDSAPWRSVVDRLDVNAQLLRAILSSLQELPTIGSNAGGAPALAVGGSTSIPVPLPIVASSTMPTTIEGQPISVKFDTPQSVSIANSSIPITIQPSRTRYFSPITAISAGITTIVAAVPNTRIRVIAFALTSNSPTTTVRFRSGNTNLTGDMNITGPLFASLPDSGLFETDVGQALDIELSLAANVTGFLVYELIPS